LVTTEAQPQLRTRRPQGFDVFDLYFDFSEVRHVSFWLMIDGSDSNGPSQERRSIIPSDACVFFRFLFSRGQALISWHEVKKDCQARFSLNLSHSIVQPAEHSGLGAVRVQG
jgi:hypothetical protein